MEQKADTIYYGGKIYGKDAKQTGTMLATKGEDVIYVGYETKEELEGIADDRTNWVDLEGHAVLPGILDSHTHPVCIALTDWRVQLKRTNDLKELLKEAQEFCRNHSREEVPYFIGESYQLTMFDEHGPRKELLDQYISDRPARMQDFTDHSCWYNSMALKLMGIEKGKPDPECIAGTPTVIVRDENGDPTGWVLEMPTDRLEQAMYDKIGWHPAAYATPESIEPFLKSLTSYGVTGLMDGFTENEESMKLFYDLDQQGKLPLYYEGMVLLPEFGALEQTIHTLREWQQKYTSKHVHVGCVKFFLDGTNEIGDCASLELLRTDPTGTDYGHINMEEDDLSKVMVRLNEEGIDFHMHMVGDRAFRTACNALEKAMCVCGDQWRIRVTSAHCELVHPDDRKRPAELGMIINWTPHWAGGYFGEKSKDYLGEERFNTMYDFSEMLDNGTCLALSSDVFAYKEANRANPFLGMQIGATRVDPEFPMDPKRYPGSMRPPVQAKMTLEQMLKAYTTGSAYQMRLEKTKGILEAGKSADFIVLSEDPFEMDVEDLSRIRVQQVYLDGKQIYFSNK